MRSGNHYVIQVKGNQKTLRQAIQQVSVEQEALSSFSEQEKGHGRHSTWTVRVFDACEHPKAKQWKNLRRFIHVHKRTVQHGLVSDNDRYYISDCVQSDAQYYHRGIRGYWAIENSLHWVKDVIHGEDGNQIRKNHGPVNAAVFSAIAINFHRKYGDQSITKSQILFATNVNELIKIIRT